MDEFQSERLQGSDPMSVKRSLLEHPQSVTVNTENIFGGPSGPYFLDTTNLRTGGTILEEPQSGSPRKLVHPNVPAFRRARAETFSSFPSKFIPEDSSSSPNGGGGLSGVGGNNGSNISNSNNSSSGGRVRSGSLSLPANDLSTVFGSSLFTTSSPWQPTDSSGGSSSGAQLMPKGSRLARAAFESVGMPMNGGEVGDDTSALARTLDYLGLDDANSSNNGNNGGGGGGNGGSNGNDNGNSNNNGNGTGGANGSSSSGAAGGAGDKQRGVASAGASPYQLHSNQFSRSQTSPKLQGLEALGISIGPPNSNHSRSRSYSVAVSENPNLGIPNSVLYRPRSSSFGYAEIVESELYRRNVGLDSPGAPSDHQDVGPTSPKLDPFGANDKPFNESPTGGAPQDHQSPTRSLWIGNIDLTLSPADLLSIFSAFGPIESLRILPEKECAFVNFMQVEDAIRAREEMQNTRIGNTVVRLGYGKADGLGESQGMQPTKSLWIGNIPPTTDPHDLESLFSTFGPVESARVLTHKNCGFVNFDRLEDAIEARKAMNGKEISGSVVKIGFAKVPTKAELAALAAGTAGLPTSRDRSGSGSSQHMMMAQRHFGGGNVFFKFLHSKRAKHEADSDLSICLECFTILEFDDGPDSLDLNGMALMLDADKYALSLMPLPEPLATRHVDQNRLREMRKRLEGHPSAKEIDMYFNEVLPETVDLCTDYIGNVVLQKIIEKGTDQHKLMLLEAVGSHMASIGVHKNGTWVVQKIIDCAKTPAQVMVIAKVLRPFTPPLLLDQFGNYVIQCCLRLGTQRNQFIFDAMHTKCWEIGQGRFGARAMRACLESQYTTKRQQKHVAIAIVQNAVQLVSNPNGALLVTWLLDTSSLPGRYRVLAPKLAPHVPALCTHKLASATILKMVNQRTELDARDVIMKEIFYRDDNSLKEILMDQVHGVSVIQKILASGCITAEERVRLADRVRSVVTRMPEVKDSHVGYKRLLDELAIIPSGLFGNSTMDPNQFSNHDIVSPLTPHVGFFNNPFAPNPPGVAAAMPINGYYPTPSHSPPPMGTAAAPYMMPNGAGYMPYYGAYPPSPQQPQQYRAAHSHSPLREQRFPTF
ncbi:hypothetical protein HDU76_012209 [Blyttiomyces sp. JEL0837]|nr:hypothetical protein HDU76_012209 [Blyttiomyces sp. JEL0837]